MLPVVLVDFTAVQEVRPPIYARVASALDLYAHLGFRDHPIWGVNVVHDGLHCEIICGWRSSTSNVRILAKFLQHHLDESTLQRSYVFQ